MFAIEQLDIKDNLVISSYSSKGFEIFNMAVAKCTLSIIFTRILIDNVVSSTA